jgi:NADPH-dependent 2,4-dienoyl-CoA reductase/sulfur reductase-like enzyme/nitrite reductase/ring-hydroxylating ferredoxin subunit
MTKDNEPTGPDFFLGFEISQLSNESITSGHVSGQDAILVRQKDDYFILGAFCSHYHAPIQDGLVVDNEIRCPWHHARFDLKTGAAICAPAFDALRAWRVEIIDGKAFARERLQPVQERRLDLEDKIKTIVIIGAGAAGFSAAFTLRAEGYQGNIEMLCADPSPPYDRPNLSKDYLSGDAPEDWLPLRPHEWYQDNNIILRPGILVEKLYPSSKKIILEGGEALSFDRLLLATGAEPIELTIPGSGIEHIHYLRTLSDSEKIIAASKNVKTAVIIGASFIGLEVAAALRKRGLEIHVVAPEAIPMARILGPEIGRFILKLHQDHGVIFHLEDSVTEIAPHKLILKSGDSIETNLVIIGVGVKPNLKLAEQAGLLIDKGVLVNSFLETSAPDIYAAGDIARWPDKLTGENIRVEHWTVAERQGQIAAKNMLGAKQTFDVVPFFWSQHYDQTISYIGHAASWNRLEISGDPITGSCAVTYYNNDKKLAVATLGRDIQNLCAEISFEKEIRNIK